MVCTRNLQVVEKKSTRAFKTLDGSLTAIDEETKKSSIVTNRCIDLDRHMPVYLGTSKAILDYVIFCHQEDSLWPLSEPIVVKKRFDEIFQVTQYAKVIETLKVIRKENAVQIKLAEKDVQYLTQEKERAEKAERRADLLVIQIDMYNEEAEELKVRMDTVSAETNEFLDRNQKFQENIYKLRTAREQRAHTEKTIERLGEGLEIMTEEDAELQTILDNFGSKTQEIKEKKDSLLLKHEEYQTKVDTSRRKLNELKVKQGQLQGETDSQVERLKERNKYIIDKSEQLNMTDIYNEATEADVENDSNLKSQLTQVEDNYIARFSKNLDRQLKRLRSEQEAIRLKGSEEENEISAKIKDLTTQKLRLEQNKLSNSNSVRAFEDEIDSLQNSIKNIQVDEGGIEFEKSNLSDLETKLAALQTKFNENDEQGELSKKKQELFAIEEEIEMNNADLVASNQFADDRAKLKLLRDDLLKRESGLKVAIEKNNSTFDQIIGKPITPETVESDLQAAITRVAKSVDVQTDLLEQAQRAVSQTETTIELANKEIQDKELESKELRKEVEEMFNSFYEGETDPVVEYETLVSELDSDLTTAIRAVEGSSFMEGYFKQAKHQAEEQNICFLCERRFESKQDRLKFIDEVVKKCENLPASDDELKEDFQLAQSNLDQAHKMGPSVKRIRSIGLNEIPSKRDELIKLRERLSEEVSEKQRKLEQLDLLKSDLKEIESLRTISGDISRNFDSIKGLEIQIENHETRFPGVDDGSKPVKTAGEIHEILSDLNNKAKIIKSEIARLQTNREKLLADINQLKNSIGNKRLDLNKMESLLSDRVNKRERISSIREKITSSRAEIAESNDQLDILNPQLKEQEQQLARAKFESTRSEKELSNKYTLVNQIHNDVQRLNKVIDDYKRKQTYERLEKCLESIKTIENEVSVVEQEITVIAAQVADEERALLDMRGYERQIQDNIEIRQLKNKLLELQILITELESHDAERNKEKYEREMTRLRNEYSQLNSKYSSKIGEIKQLDDQLKAINEELQTEFLDVKEKHQRSVINSETRRIGNDDLAKYSKAMDTAIMQYHSKKMEEINQIIDELWKKTYSGTDVDTILIRSDQETARGNRTYNYRVCMVKDDAEMDMRGRCSAGQKVLSCIIIRLALAECFGSKCGIITLDEPTTNLDKVNCEALAKSLGQIIESRRKQDNFQLVVITHDQEFIKSMDASSFTDKYFKLSRSATQGSKIDCLPISQIMYD